MYCMWWYVVIRCPDMDMTYMYTYIVLVLYVQYVVVCPLLAVHITDIPTHS
jgi:hypothetical protein